MHAQAGNTLQIFVDTINAIICQAYTATYMLSFWPDIHDAGANVQATTPTAEQARSSRNSRRLCMRIRDRVQNNGVGRGTPLVSTNSMQPHSDIAFILAMELHPANTYPTDSSPHNAAPHKGTYIRAAVATVAAVASATRTKQKVIQIPHPVPHATSRIHAQRHSKEGCSTHSHLRNTKQPGSADNETPYLLSSSCKQRLHWAG